MEKEMSVEVEFLSRVCPADGNRHHVTPVIVYRETSPISHRERACTKCGLRDTYIEEATG